NRNFTGVQTCALPILALLVIILAAGVFGYKSFKDINNSKENKNVEEVKSKKESKKEDKKEKKKDEQRTEESTEVAQEQTTEEQADRKSTRLNSSHVSI